jgi:uridine kinase
MKPSHIIRVQKKPVVVCIAGGTGSGKTVLANALVSHLAPNETVLIQQDFYYKNRNKISSSKRKTFNYDHPDSLDIDLLIQHVKKLIHGDAIKAPIYNFAMHRRSNHKRKIHPAKIILLEGTLLLTGSKLRNLADIKIFIDVEDDIRFIRRLQRDVTERRRNTESVIQQYLATVKPMHTEFVEPSKRYADIIIHDTKNSLSVDAIVHLIKNRAGENEGL